MPLPQACNGSGYTAARGTENGGELEEDDEYAWFTYEYVLDAAKHAIKNKEPGFTVGNVMSAQDELHANLEHFWVCIEVILGMKVPDEFKENSSFRCAC